MAQTANGRLRDLHQMQVEEKMVSVIIKIVRYSKTSPSQNALNWFKQYFIQSTFNIL